MFTEKEPRLVLRVTSGPGFAVLTAGAWSPNSDLPLAGDCQAREDTCLAFLPCFLLPEPPASRHSAYLAVLRSLGS